MSELNYKELRDLGYKHRQISAWLDQTSLWEKTISNKLIQVHFALPNRSYVYLEPDGIFNIDRKTKPIEIHSVEELKEFENRLILKENS